MGFFVTMRNKLFLSSCINGLSVDGSSKSPYLKKSFTSRSSIEWKVMMATLPPVFKSGGTCCNISFSAPISSFTSMRSAWKTCAKYLFGLPLTTGLNIDFSWAIVCNGTWLRFSTMCLASVFEFVTSPYCSNNLCS